MKTLILLFVTSILLISCTAEPLPSTMSLNNKHIGKYHIEWNSNQYNPSMSIKVLRQGQYVIDLKNIKSKSYDVILHDNDMITIGVNYEDIIERPEVYLAIYKYKNMNLSSGVYTPDTMTLLYEQESNTNAFGFNGCVKSLNQ